LKYKEKFPPPGRGRDRVGVKRREEGFSDEKPFVREGPKHKKREKEIEKETPAVV
jgi:hypothetical protein